MRNRTVILIGALLLTSAGTARAQQEPRPAAPQVAQPARPAASSPTATSPKLAVVDFGIRGDNLKGDAARYNRFRDLREGLYVSRFKLEKETESWFFRGQANNIGYRDQQYFADFENIGRLKAGFEWNQVPLFISDATRTLYTDRGNGVLEVDDAIQQTLQNTQSLPTAQRSAALTAALGNVMPGARQFDMRSRRDNARFNLVYMLNRDVDLKFSAKTSHRKGYNLMSFGLGTSPGLSPALEMGVPTDDRTTDINGSVVFANAKGLVSLGYRGSWYDNAIPTVRFDNPLRINSLATGGTSVGQAVLWPTNTSFAVDANGSYKLPRRTRVGLALSVGRWSQDEPLVQATVNPALLDRLPVLPRATANTEADIRSAVFSFNSRPFADVTVNAKYRYYDYDNKSEHFAISNAIIGDWAAGTQFHETEPASFKRKTADLDISYAPFDYVSFAIGGGREEGDRTFRIFEKTTENVFRASVDSTGNQYVTVRAKYERSRREGDGFELHLLEEVGEQPGTRHFDIADRARTRLTTILTVTPTAWLALNGSVANGHDDYFGSAFGLRDNENRAYSAGFDVVPRDTVSFGVNYGREKYTALQRSRTAVPLGNTSGPNEFNDPRRDWTIDQDDKVNTFSANLDLLKTFPKTDIRLSYDLSDGKATYVYGTQPDAPRVTVPSSSPNAETAVAIPVQLSPVKNKLTGARTDVQYFVRPNIAVGVAYWFEEYKVQDFALDGTIINALSPANASTGIFASTIYSGYLYRPYKVHTGWLKISYLW
jgi:MtrB/PioB family decaheme-associated outer membrane protein